MKRGPATGAAPAGPTMAEKAAIAFSGQVPDWIAELAQLADRDGLKAAAARVNYSPSAISNVINGRYQKGNLARVEECVRGALMGATVDCPALGTIGRDRCLDWQKKPYAPTSSFRVEMFNACRAGCPHSKLKDQA